MDDYIDKFPMAHIDRMVDVEGSCSTSTHRLSTTETTVLNNTDSDVAQGMLQQSPSVFHNNDISAESGFSFRSPKATGLQASTSALLKARFEKGLDSSSLQLSPMQNCKIVASTPISNLDEVDGIRPEIRSIHEDPEVPEPLHSLINPLVGSQDPIDAFLITKVDVHKVSNVMLTHSNLADVATTHEDTVTQPLYNNELPEETIKLKEDSQATSGTMTNFSAKDNEYVLMINNNSSNSNNIVPHLDERDVIST